MRLFSRSFSTFARSLKELTIFCRSEMVISGLPILAWILISWFFFELRIIYWLIIDSTWIWSKLWWFCAERSESWNNYIETSAQAWLLRTYPIYYEFKNNILSSTSVRYPNLAYLLGMEIRSWNILWFTTQNLYTSSRLLAWFNGHAYVWIWSMSFKGTSYYIIEIYNNVP